MLQILVKADYELYDEKTEQFILLNDTILKLEHSLISISKWESKWKKSFISTKEKTVEETIDYIKCMTLNKDVDPYIYSYLSEDNINDIKEYIQDPFTATKLYNPENNRRNNEVITSELIYYWMISLKIPVEFEKWHVNRLLTLIEVCSVKNQPPKKMSKRQILQNYDKINEQRKAKLHTRG